jgi:hypothetical protein
MKSFMFLFALILAIVFTAPAFAAPVGTTPLLTIQNGYSKRETINTVLGTVTTARLASTAGVGAKNGATVAATEYGDGTVHTTVLTLTATPLTVRDTQQGNGVKIYDFPVGRIAILGATGAVNFTTTSAIATTLKSGVSSRWGVGTVTQANATLATTEQDLIPVKTFLSSTTINVEPTLVPGALAATAQFDGTSTAIAAFLNVSVPGATDIDADATVTATGNVTITWINLGDY